MEIAIKKHLAKYLIPDFTRMNIISIRKSNSRGIMLDMQVVENAIAFDEKRNLNL